jgi:hypothetical protein
MSYLCTGTRYTLSSTLERGVISAVLHIEEALGLIGPTSSSLLTQMFIFGSFFARSQKWRREALSWILAFGTEVERVGSVVEFADWTAVQGDNMVWDRKWTLFRKPNSLIYVFTSVAYTNPDPSDQYVFRHPGSGYGSISQRYGSGSDWKASAVLRIRIRDPVPFWPLDPE